MSHRIDLDFMDAPRWVDKHSVTCIECDCLTDERDAAYSEDRGYLCPDCAKALHREYRVIIDWLNEGHIDEDIAQNVSNTRHLLRGIKCQLDRGSNIEMYKAVKTVLQQGVKE